MLIERKRCRCLACASEILLGLLLAVLAASNILYTQIHLAYAACLDEASSLRGLSHAP